LTAQLCEKDWDLARTPWFEIWERSMEFSVRKLWQRLAPRTWLSPQGKKVAVHYNEAGDPIIEAKLQWFLGLDIHPQIGGKPATLVLLGPHGRPIQTTQDLPRFWRGSYLEIRKEMRGRYPKQPWPERPWE
jgi:ATP-dependent helicase HrpB